MKSKVTIFFLALFLGVCSLSAHAQVTKADVEQLFVDAGITEKDVKEVCIKNIVSTRKDMYNNISWAYQSENFEKKEFKNMPVTLIASGIKVRLEFEISGANIVFYPYSSIKYIVVKSDGVIIIELRE